MSGYMILCDAQGAIISGRGGDEIALVADVDDSCAWGWANDAFQCDATNQRISAIKIDDSRYCLKHARNDLNVWVRSVIPERPSAYLKRLTEDGFVVVPGVMDERARARFKAQAADVRAREHQEESPTDGYFWMREGLSWSIDLAQATTHPLVLSILRKYLTTKDIHYCHQPVITTLKPAQALLNTFPDKGWHSDYPYHAGVFPEDEWPDTPVLGAQFNICVDPFEAETGATQFVPESHKFGRSPDPEFNVGGTRMGVGQHAKVEQMLAPAGAALLYDARTWHRACHELNTSGQDRIAILNAVAPAWVRPMMEKAVLGATFNTSSVAPQLNARERDEVSKLCLSPAQETPEGMPRLRAKPPPEIRRA